ncbi:MAG TPA: hypothetical protein VFB22_11530 [Candidatus Baltobacteraceae bacterium]|nr:hypothetical protein [Candidatus Baltobacteraceae bacterium]
MDFVNEIDPAELAKNACVAESDQFAIYALGNDTYLLVQRHAGSPWSGLRLSGDGIFRAGSLLVDAMRHLYRDVARDLSPDRRGVSERG